MQGYAKVFTRILDSTVWRENNPTRILWIAMLALADQDGIVHCTIPGLADRAKISLEECEYALGRFMQPDKYSWSKENEGRRIQEVEGGWFIINHHKFRELMSIEERRERTRIRVERHRAQRKQALQSVTPVTSGTGNASNDKQKHIQKHTTTPPTPPSRGGCSKRDVTKITTEIKKRSTAWVGMRVQDIDAAIDRICTSFGVDPEEFRELTNTPRVVEEV